MNGTHIVEVQLHRAATLLQPILDRMVFTGGAIRGLLVTDPAVDAPRPTHDIDTIIEVSSLAQYHVFELELRKQDGPACARDVQKNSGILSVREGTV